MNPANPDAPISASADQSIRALAEQLATVDARIDALQGQRAALYRAAKRYRVSRDQLRAMALAARLRATQPHPGGSEGREA